jgi:opacity protein-like surface antigen
VAYNFNRFFGVAGDVGGYHASPGGVSLNTYTYLFGPRITVRNPTKVNPFFQFLLGGAHLTAGGGGGSANNFAYSVGGGVDVAILPHVALRPQYDYVGLRNSGQTTNCSRVSISAVVHF